MKTGCRRKKKQRSQSLLSGDSKGYFDTIEKQIAVQENMSESQTLKTMVYEVAHSMLHDKEINQSMDVPAKDRNTKEAEAESVAFSPRKPSKSKDFSDSRQIEPCVFLFGWTEICLVFTLFFYL